MSMYEMVFGTDGRGRAEVLLPLLGNPDVGRFRDCWIEKAPDGDPVIAVYTRNGGGNRPDYADVITALQQHELYLRDTDDDFDSTYATFYFRTPAKYRDMFRQVAGDPVDMDERWAVAIEAIGGAIDGTSAP
jgi:hypothetical protein